MNVLVINAGSSSLKYQLIRIEDETVLCSGLCERIGIDGKFTYKPQVEGKETLKAVDVDMPTHSEAIQAVLDALVDPKNGVIGSMKEIDAVGHRVVHGGEAFSQSVRITPEVMKELEACIPLAPLHNPANITGINACTAVMGEDVPQVAVFDTAFHQTMPAKAYMFGLPYKYYEQYGIRRYGFHGTSHRFISGRIAEILGEMPHRLITCHLGNGSSISAILDGQVIDTTMGFTPLDGLLMGTRCGSIDPSIVTYIQNAEPETDMDAVMNKQSGFLGISGVSSDMRDIENAAAEGNERAQLALEMQRYQIVKFIGAYAAALGGVDAVLFTGGIGENGKALRAKVVEELGYLGAVLDAEANDCRGKEVCITTPDSKLQAWVVPTNEELVIARDTAALAK